MFAELLRCSPHLLHLRAEINPFLRLAGLGWPEDGRPDDSLDATDIGDRELLLSELARDIGQPAALTRPDVLAADIAWRLTVQWPQPALSLSDVAAWVTEALSLYGEQDGPFCRVRDHAGFHLHLLRRAAAVNPSIEPWFYDLPPDRVQTFFPGRALPTQAPDDLIEEAPFVAVGPWSVGHPPGPLPLVIKTPSNAYRLSFLRFLFPNARFRVLHLVRNPAAAINGLYDGWRFHGFHAHKMDAPLDIAGYTDQRPWDARWWKFDLPPNWQPYRTRPLEQVCAFQWRSAHGALLRWTAQHPDVDVLRVRFEDMLGARRGAVLAQVADWLGIPVVGPFARAVAEGLPPVMATAPPRQRRWFARAATLESVLSDPEVVDVAHALGYRDREEWV